MNILHLHLSKSWGGGGVQMLNLNRELKKSNPEVKNVFICVKQGVLHSKCKEHDLKHYPIKLKSKLSLKVAVKLLKIIKKEKVDLIHIHGSSALTCFYLANLLQKTPPGIFHKKTTFKIKKKFFTQQKYNHKNIKRIICVSNAVKEITKKGIKNPERAVTVYTGTDINKTFTEEIINLRKDLSIQKDQIIIGNIANHINAKDLSTLVKTADDLVNTKEQNQFIFLQIGKENDLTHSLKKMVKDYKLEDNFKFLGAIPDAAAYMDQFDTFLLTSKSEGLPQVIYEAFLHKTPVVTTNAGGTAEIVTHKHNGFVSEIGDYKSLANNLIEIVSNKEETEKFISRSYNKLIPDLTTTKMAQNILSIYKETIQTS